MESMDSRACVVDAELARGDNQPKAPVK